MKVHIKITHDSDTAVIYSSWTVFLGSHVYQTIFNSIKYIKKGECHKSKEIVQARSPVSPQLTLLYLVTVAYLQFHILLLEHNILIHTLT